MLLSPDVPSFGLAVVGGALPPQFGCRICLIGRIVDQLNLSKVSAACVSPIFTLTAVFRVAVSTARNIIMIDVFAPADPSIGKWADRMASERVVEAYVSWNVDYSPDE